MKRSGFTLVETIAVLLLMSVLALSIFIALIPVSEGLAQARENSDIAQKTHLAMARLFRELTTITNVVQSGPALLSYDYLDPAGVSHRRTLNWTGNAGDPLLLNNVPLADDVNMFALRYFAGDGGAPAAAWSSAAPVVEIELQVRGGGIVYTNRIAPRNI